MAHVGDKYIVFLFVRWETVMNIEKNLHFSRAERRLYGNSGIIVLEDLTIVGSVHCRYGGEVGSWRRGRLRGYELKYRWMPGSREEEVASRRASYDTG